MGCPSTVASGCLAVVVDVLWPKPSVAKTRQASNIRDLNEVAGMGGILPEPRLAGKIFSLFVRRTTRLLFELANTLTLPDSFAYEWLFSRSILFALHFVL